MTVVRLTVSLSIAWVFAWLGLWLIGSADLGFPARLQAAGMALLLGAPAWAFVTNGVLKRALEPALAEAQPARDGRLRP